MLSVSNVDLTPFIAKTGTCSSAAEPFGSLTARGALHTPRIGSRPMSKIDPWDTAAGWFWVAYTMGIAVAITLTLT
jgi:hypothetical protein